MFFRLDQKEWLMIGEGSSSWRQKREQNKKQRDYN